MRNNEEGSWNKVRRFLGSIDWRVAAKMAASLLIGLLALYVIIAWITHPEGLAFVVRWWSRLRPW